MRRNLNIITLFFISFFLFSCYKDLPVVVTSVFSDEITIFEENLSEFQIDFFETFICSSIEKSEFGYYVEYHETDNWFSKSFALLGEDEFVWNIGPYSFLSIIEENEDTFYMYYQIDRNEKGRFLLSKNTGEKSYHSTYDYLFAYIETEDGFISNSRLNMFSDDSHFIKKIYEDYEETIFEYEAYWTDKFIDLGNNTYLIKATMGENHVNIDESIIIIDSFGNVIVEESLDTDVVEFVILLTGFLVKHSDNTFVLYDLEFNEVTSTSFNYRTGSIYSYIAEVDDGVIIKLNKYTGYSYIKLSFNGEVIENYDYKEKIIERYQITFYKQLVLYSNDDFIALERIDDIYHLYKEDKNGNIIWDVNLGDIFFSYNVQSDSIVISVRIDNNEYRVFSFEGEEIESGELECQQALPDIVYDTYVCYFDKALTKFDLDNNILWQSDPINLRYPIHETSFNSYLVRHDKDNDVVNALPSPSSSLLTLISGTGETILEYEELSALDSFIYEGKTYFTGYNINDLYSHLYVYEIDQVGNIINDYILVSTITDEDNKIYIVLIEDKLVYFHIPKHT